MAERGTVKDLLFTLADEVVSQNVDYDIILIQVENIREMLAEISAVNDSSVVFTRLFHTGCRGSAEAVRMQSRSVWQRLSRAAEPRLVYCKYRRVSSILSCYPTFSSEHCAPCASMYETIHK